MSTQSQFDVLTLLGAAARTTTGNSAAGIDLQGYINPGGRQMKAYLDVGAITTATVLTVAIYDGDDSTQASHAAISGATFTGLAVANTTATNQTIHFRTNKRYVSAVTTFTNGGGVSFGVYLLAEKRVK
jgi:hypothetical protein